MAIAVAPVSRRRSGFEAAATTGSRLPARRPRNERREDTNMSEVVRPDRLLEELDRVQCVRLPRRCATDLGRRAAGRSVSDFRTRRRTRHQAWRGRARLPEMGVANAKLAVRPAPQARLGIERNADSVATESDGPSPATAPATTDPPQGLVFRVCSLIITVKRDGPCRCYFRSTRTT